MSQANIEKTMDEYLVKKAPFQIPVNGRKALVSWLPYLALIFGVLSALAAIGLWNTGHNVDEAVRTLNEWGAAYGIETQTAQLGVVYYISLVAVALQAVLLLVAFPGLKARSKPRGWNIMLYGVGASLAYGVLIAFTNYGSAADLVGSLIGALIGLYLLAQIRSYYKG